MELRVSDSRHRVLPIWKALAILVGVAVAMVLIYWTLPALLNEHPSHGIRAADKLSAMNQTRVALIQGAAGAALLAGLIYTAATFRLTRSGQLTDRYTKAADQLGSESISVRAAGVYALHRVAIDRAAGEYSDVVRDVLAAFIRSQSAELRKKEAYLSADLEAAVDVIVHELPMDSPSPLYLREAWLRRARLREGRLTRAYLRAW
jgi:hypothetical protein